MADGVKGIMRYVVQKSGEIEHGKLAVRSGAGGVVDWGTGLVTVPPPRSAQQT